jgi:hypothetical protein
MEWCVRGPGDRARSVYSLTSRDTHLCHSLQDKVRLCYMTTIRADFSVAAKSEVDGQWYFNVMAFEQQDCCDVASGEYYCLHYSWCSSVAAISLISPPPLPCFQAS